MGEMGASMEDGGMEDGDTENGGENGRTSTAGFLNGMAKTLPPMLQVMRDIGGVELPEALVKLQGEDVPGAASGATGPAGKDGDAGASTDTGKSAGPSSPK